MVDTNGEELIGEEEEEALRNLDEFLIDAKSETYKL
jgi:hypothetical protein